jgi:hypothetical protein
MARSSIRPWYRFAQERGHPEQHADAGPAPASVRRASVEVDVQAPKSFERALSPDGETLATLSSGAPCSPTSIGQIHGAAPSVKRLMRCPFGPRLLEVETAVRQPWR